MNARTIRLARSAIACLLLGITLGLLFAFDRSLGTQWRPVHVEANLWGWATLLIYGMAYHMLPRFSGRPLHSERLAEIQSWSAIVGVAAAIAGIFLQSTAVGEPLCIIGGLLQLTAALLFISLIGPLLYPKGLLS